MNYRHAFHAGNFADVVKHVTLTRILTLMQEKPAALRVIDTHAGAGVYDLAAPEATRSGEWRAGIGRLVNASLEPAIRALLAPYLAAVARVNPAGGLRSYPGSPAIALAMLRAQDRLTACELEPQAAAALSRLLRRDARAKAVSLDGWVGLKAYIPPRERRGIVMIDPPFEAADEFARLAEALVAAHRKWPTGVYVAWYPIKDRREPETLARRLARDGVGKVMGVDFSIGAQGADRLRACGLLIINPPWRLPDELSRILPALARVLAGGGGSASITKPSGSR